MTASNIFKPSAHVTTRTQYPNADTRGQIRLWKLQLAQQFRRFERGMRETENSDTHAFMHKTGIGRRRVFDKIVKALGSGVTLEWLHLDSARPHAVWSILKPRDSTRVTLDDAPTEQDCITVNYVLFGAAPPQRGWGGIYDGLWTLEITDHALGRLWDRPDVLRASKPALLKAAIMEAHHNVLRLPAEIVLPDHTLEHEFKVRAGPGAFICRVRSGNDISARHEPMFYIHATTWIADDMKHDDQVFLIGDGEPGKRLIDGWLAPHPHRLIEQHGNKLYVSTWGRHPPSDLLAAPKGSA